MRLLTVSLGIFCFVSALSFAADAEITTEALLAEDSFQLVLQGPEKKDSATEAAYIQGALDATFPKDGVRVEVHSGVATLSNLPSNKKEARAIIDFTRKLTSKPIERPSPQCTKTEGLAFPESTVLYPTQVANPRQIAYSAALRVSDPVSGRWSGPVSFADRFPMYRWTNLWKGDVQLEIEAGVFSIFNLSKHDYPLLNTDYYVGLPLTYKKDDWRGKVRLYHVSSHLGDEYLKHHPHTHRKNKSYEALDASCAYYLFPEWYFFGTIGDIFASDSEYRTGNYYVEYGFEVRGQRKNFDQLFRQPFLSVFLRNAQESHFREDMTIAVGYEWGKITNVGRLLRAFFEYHQGYSQEGQFSHRKSDYLAFKLSYGF